MGLSWAPFTSCRGRLWSVAGRPVAVVAGNLFEFIGGGTAKGFDLIYEKRLDKFSDYFESCTSSM